MAHIRQHRRGFRADVALAGHKRVSRSFETREQAATWAKETERELRAGSLMDPRRHTFAKAVDTYLGSRRAHTLSSHDRNVLRWWKQQLGARSLHKLGRRDFAEVRERIVGRDGRELAPATVNRRMALASSVLTDAMERGWLEHHPARLRRLREDNEREFLIDAAQRARLIDACGAGREPDLLAFVLCVMVSGCRAGELVRMRWSDVDLDAGHGRLRRTKSGKPRSVPLRGPALAVLRRMHADREPAPTAHVFRHRTGRAPFRYARAWHTARHRAGIPELHVHDLRHQAASLLMAAGASDRAVMEVMGHSSPKVAARYQHFRPGDNDHLGDLLADRLFATVDVVPPADQSPESSRSNP